MKSSNIIRIEGKQDTPKVIIDENELLVKISGNSFNEAAIDIFYQIIDWIQKIENTFEDELKFEFDFVYINSASKKMIFVIINHLDRIYKTGKKVSADWYYNEYDEDMMDLGKDFTDCVSFPFESIAKKDI